MEPLTMAEINTARADLRAAGIQTEPPRPEYGEHVETFDDATAYDPWDDIIDALDRGAGEDALAIVAPRLPEIRKACASCDGLFYPRQRGQRYCERKCQMRALMRERRRAEIC